MTGTSAGAAEPVDPVAADQLHGGPEGATPQVSVVIISYNTRDWIEGCLASLPGAARGREIEVVVVDNASRDGSADAIDAAFPEVRLVRNDENEGFARAVNTGARLARGRYLLLVNPDGHLRPGCIDQLVDFAEAHPEHVITGGRTVTPDGDLDPRSCWAAPTLASLASSALMLSTLRPGSRLDPEAMGDFARDHARTVDVVTGCLLLVRLDDWRALGGFDERFFVYGEDADLCLRARATTGRTCAITPDAVMVHAVGESSATRPDKVELLLKGRISLVRTHLPGWRGHAGAALVVAGVGVRAAVGATGLRRDAAWGEVWARRARWWRGYPPAVAPAGDAPAAGDADSADAPPPAATGRSKLRHGWERRTRFVRSVLDPRSVVQAAKLLHYFHYTHVGEAGKVTAGPEVRWAPNVSFANGGRITIGARSRVGARTHLWAGDVHGRITIGDDCNLAPLCFVTASNYGTEAGTLFLDQQKQDADVTLGDGVWLGAGVMVMPGVTIGDGTIVAAGAVVTRDLPAGVIAGGTPARVIRER